MDETCHIQQDECAVFKTKSPTLLLTDCGEYYLWCRTFYSSKFKKGFMPGLIVFRKNKVPQ